ncbi:MAG: hypothetical protein AAB316_13755, partial [Bacteroidota bacterium]
MKSMLYPFIYAGALAWCLAVPQRASGQNFATHFVRNGVVEGAALSTGGQIELDVRKQLAASPLRRKTVAAALSLKLDLGADFLDVLGSGVLQLEIGYKVLKTNGMVEISSGTLKLSNAAPEQVQRLDFLSELNTDAAFDKIRVEITSLNYAYTPASAAVDNYVNARRRLSAKVTVEYEVDVREAAGGILASPLVILPKNGGTLTNRVQDFQWQINGDTFPNYEIQILRL